MFAKGSHFDHAVFVHIYTVHESKTSNKCANATMDNTFATVCAEVVSQLQNGLQGRRYSSTTLFKRMGRVMSQTSVRFFPVGARRIINIGNSGKWFVLQYAGEDACVRIDVRRMIEKPHTTQDIATTVQDLVVFCLSMPFVGTPSVNTQQLQDWVQSTWDGLTEPEKKTGRAFQNSTMFPGEVQRWWLPYEKAVVMADWPIAVTSFKITQQTADGTTWCDYLTGMLPQQPQMVDPVVFDLPPIIDFVQADFDLVDDPILASLWQGFPTV